MFTTIKIVMVYTVLGIPAALVGIPVSYAIGRIGWLYRLTMRIMRAALWVGGIEVRVTGLDEVPLGRACIFMCNHVSNLDPPVILPNLPGRSAVMLKRELMRIPLLGTAMRMAKFVPVERNSSRESAQRTVAAAAEALRLGYHVLVFPEGTRSKTGHLSAFKKGPFFLARETGAPIVPVAVTGTQGMMRKGSFAVYPGVAGMELLPAIWPEAYGSREELMQAVRDALTAALPESMRPEAAA